MHGALCQSTVLLHCLAIRAFPDTSWTNDKLNKPSHPLPAVLSFCVLSSNKAIDSKQLPKMYINMLQVYALLPELVTLLSVRIRDVLTSFSICSKYFEDKK
jgi:hypothetical protein